MIMKKTLKFYLIPLLMVFVISNGCKKTFQDDAINNNVPTSVPASLLLNGILYGMVDFPGNGPEIYGQ